MLRAIVPYDVPDNSLRSRIAALLFDYGLTRIQKSVFLGEITRNRAEMLSVDLSRLIEGQEADIRIILLCDHCPDNQIIVSQIYEVTAEREEAVAVI